MSTEKDEKQAVSEETEEITEETPSAEAKTDESAEKKSEKKPSRKERKAEEKKAEEQIAAMNDKYLLLLAEYDNYRKRTQKEKDNLYGDIRADVLSKFLPVYDNLERALNQPTEDEAYRKGVEMIMAQFKTTMEKLGVTEIESMGQKFDPTLHNAIMHVDDEEKGENEIVDVFQKGFKIGEKVIRFAMVKVAN